MTDAIHPVNHQETSRDVDAHAKVEAAMACLKNAHDQATGFTSIWEIAANVLGSEEVAVFTFDQPKAVLWLQGCIGVDRRRYMCLDVMREPRLMCALTGEIIFVGERKNEKLLTLPDPVSALIPIFTNNEITGIIVIFRLLPQRPPLNAVDRAICRVLSTCASRAIQPMVNDQKATERDEKR